MTIAEINAMTKAEVERALDEVSIIKASNEKEADRLPLTHKTEQGGMFLLKSKAGTYYPALFQPGTNRRTTIDVKTVLAFGKRSNIERLCKLNALLARAQELGVSDATWYGEGGEGKESKLEAGTTARIDALTMELVKAKRNLDKEMETRINVELDALLAPAEATEKRLPSSEVLKNLTASYELA